MNAEIITIGDEILIGQILDSNSAYIAKKLNSIGIDVHQISSVSDRASHIDQALKEAQSRADLVIVTGGLGPTKDDVTKHTLCSYFNDILVENSQVQAHIRDLFAKYVTTPVNDINLNQALLPSKADILHNEFGTAAGMWFANEQGIVVSLPGVPYEMKAIVENELLPKLIEKFNRPFIIHKTLNTYGLGESAIAELLETWESSLPEEIKLAYLPNLGKVRLRLTAKGTEQKSIHRLISDEFNRLQDLVGPHVDFLSEEADIESEIAAQLTDKGMTLALAESFTGGALSAVFTSISGASAYFKGSVVSYATEVKESVLGVSPELIKKHSVVSGQVAEAMALGVKSRLQSDFAVATTGNAGPTKGDSEVEIGTVYIAIASPKGVFSKKFQLGKNRERVVQKGINTSLTLLFEEILNF
jgi:nicotinamide-nucleotide amidase